MSSARIASDDRCGGADREPGPERRELSGDEADALRYELLPAFIRESGLLIRVDDRGATMLTISPPLVADTDLLDGLLMRVDRILDRTDAWLGGAR